MKLVETSVLSARVVNKKLNTDFVAFLNRGLYNVELRTRNMSIHREPVFARHGNAAGRDTDRSPASDLNVQLSASWQKLHLALREGDGNTGDTQIEIKDWNTVPCFGEVWVLDSAREAKAAALRDSSFDRIAANSGQQISSNRLYERAWTDVQGQVCDYQAVVVVSLTSDPTNRVAAEIK